MKPTSIQINPSLFLVCQPITAARAAPVSVSLNHIAVIDCSGSMYDALPKVRAQLKAKLPKLMNAGDTLSLVWFSGRGQFGTLLEAEPIATLADLTVVNKAIDRWIQPQGATGFKEPIAEIESIVKRVKNKNANPFALFFMSDGCDNVWPRSELLATVERVSKHLVSSTFVEYGYYADRALLAAMAEKAGGSLIFADTFDKYQPAFDGAISQKLEGTGKRIEVAIPGDTIGGFVYAITGEAKVGGKVGEIITYNASEGKALVNEGTREVFYLSPTPTMVLLSDDAHCRSEIYAAMSLFAVRMKPEIVFPLLKLTGDVRFIEMFASCFGKQKYSEFMGAATAATFDINLRCVKGYNPNLVPADDAFTVLDVLKVLSDDEDSRILLDDKSFSYSRISRKQVDANENLSAAEQEQLIEIQLKMSNESNAKKLKECQAEIDALIANKRDALKFIAEPQADGYPITSLTYNSSSPNVSVLVRKIGTVDLSQCEGADILESGDLETAFPTFIYRNYAIIANGLVNVEKLPVDISKETYRKLAKAGVRLKDTEDGVTTIDLRPLPILNRKMVKTVSMKDAIELEYRLTKLKAAAKVYKDYVKELYPDAKLAGYADKYGEDAAAWLKEQGFTEYSGFGPKRVQAPSVDFIMGKELDIKLKGYSTMPPTLTVKTKLANKSAKFNGPETMMAVVIKEVEAFLNDNPKKLHQAWLTGKEKSTISEVRALQHQLSQIVFSIIVGQTWFVEFATLDDKTLTVKIDGIDITGVADLREVEIKV